MHYEFDYGGKTYVGAKERRTSMDELLQEAMSYLKISNEGFTLRLHTGGYLLVPEKAFLAGILRIVP